MSETKAASPPAAAPPGGRFVTGSTMRHITVMTLTGAAGLLAIFLADLANIYFLSQLGDLEVTAAIGFATTVLFFGTSTGIGLAIAVAALVARAIGGGRPAEARRLATSTLVLAAGLTGLLALSVWLLRGPILSALGASGRPAALAADYLGLTLPSLPALAVAMAASGALRAVGDARRATAVTLSGALLTVPLDALLILGLGLGLPGAAVATNLARLGMLAVALHGVGRGQALLERPSLARLREDGPLVAAIATPAILTNLATPVGNAVLTAALAPFGDSAVAGWTVIFRIAPVAFGTLFALTGAVGPVLGQNFGAGAFGRLREAFGNALLFNLACCLAAWLGLALAAPFLVTAFHLSGEGADLVRLFCQCLAPLFTFHGALFVANAAFNNLGRPHLSTLLSWGRATFGTMPFVWLGGQWGGAAGAVTGSLLGTLAFGVLAVVLCYRLIDRLPGPAQADATRPAGP